LAWSKAARAVFGGVVSQFGESAVFPNWRETFTVLQALERVMGAPGKEVHVDLRLVTGVSVQHYSVLLCSSHSGLVGFRLL
jgi:hypothetical protein